MLTNEIVGQGKGELSQNWGQSCDLRFFGNGVRNELTNEKERKSQA
jgi:hypothetical protein